MEPVIIYTDGACRPNPGKGGWGSILMYKDAIREMSGGNPDTTNNRMELMAAIEALEALKRPCTVVLHSDSKYVIDGISKWIINWKKSNWKSGTVKNQDLWQRLDAAASSHQMTWKWVKSHSGNLYNERADALAFNAIPISHRTYA